MLQLIRDHLNCREIAIVLLFILSLVLGSFWPKVGDNLFGRIERFASGVARRKRLALLFVGLIPVLIRLSLLPLFPVPVPQVHDEFSYLLAADTFASGRLTNPPHPMSLFLDTIHVNQQPTYMSKYPPAQGMILALGQIVTGQPWTGVALSVGIMCAVVLWMLQGWLPPKWAFLGAALVILRIGIFSYWMNSYWGGAVPAIGGALVLGAVPRLLKAYRTRYSLLMGIGASILMNSRPLEGLAICVPVGVFVLLTLLFKGPAPSMRSVCSLLLPCAAVLLFALLFTGYYDWRSTGHALLMPYLLNENNYWSTPTLLWYKPRPAIHFSNAQFEAFYNVWSRNLWLESNRSVFRHAASVILKFVYFFCWPELCLPLLSSLLVLRDRKLTFLFVEIAACFVAVMVVAWFQPHYAAPVVGAVFGVLTQAIRRIRFCKLGDREVGLALTRVVLIFAIILSPFHPHSISLEKNSKGADRAKLEAQLESMPGKHLVIVRYSSGAHSPLLEWVYNRADVDNSKVVWAREIPGQNMQILLHYFHERQMWLVEPDSTNPTLTSYNVQ